MNTARRLLQLAGLALCGIPISCGAATNCRDQTSERWYSSDHRLGVNIDALEKVERRYGTIATYRDMGSTVKVTRSASKRFVDVSFFDTLFLRNLGLRFRTYDEHRTPKYILWSYKGITLTWHVGTVSTAASVEEALAAVRGITNFISEIVPPLLEGRETIPTERDFLHETFALAGTEPSCGKCFLFVLGSPSKHRQHVLTVDQNEGAIRRVQSFITLPALAGGEPHELVQAESVTIYQPNFATGDPGLERELAEQPW